jgi:enoyl-CoA hydratase/carnithine racemase
VPSIDVERRGQVEILTLRGDNDLNLGVVNEDLYQRLIEVRDDDQVACAVVTGAGSRAFSAGADLKALTASSADGGPRRNPWTVRVLTLLTSELDKPIVAAVNGHALGQGLVLALACDMRLAAEHATFGLPEVKHGMVPAVEVIRRLQQVMPVGPALELVLTGDRIGAGQAYHWGLVNRVVPAAELLAAALELAEHIVSNPSSAVRALKQLSGQVMRG